MNPRVAYVCADRGVPVFGSKGCSVHVQEMLRAFERMGAKVEVFAAARGMNPPQDLQRIVVHDLFEPNTNSTSDHGELNARIRSSIRSAGPFDLIYERHALWSFAAMEYAQEACVPGALEINAPLIEEQVRHRSLVDIEGAKRARRRSFDAASILLPVSDELAAHLDLNHLDNCSVLPNAVDPDRFAPPEPGDNPEIDQMPDQPFTVGFVGTLKPWHGIDELADGFARLRETVVDARLLVVGDGPMRERLERRLAAYGLSSATEFSGAIRPDEIPGWLHRMDAAVAPYPDDGETYFSPLKILEYLASGRPIVASRMGQIRSLIEHGVTGLLHEPGDCEVMAKHLVALASDETLRKRLGRAARAAAVEQHSWNKSARRILELSGVRV